MLDPARRFDVPGFPQARVYRDHQQAQTYYVVPWSAGIAIDANGRPECRLLLFVKRGPDGPIATGGQLSLTATLSIPAADLARLKQSIESSLTPAAVPGEPPPRPVVVQLANPDWAGGRVTITPVTGVILTGQPSLGGENRCALMASLTADGARALQEQWHRGLPDARVAYDMIMRVATSQSASGSLRQETVAAGATRTAAFDVDVHGTFAATQPLSIAGRFPASGLDSLVTEITL